MKLFKVVAYVLDCNGNSPTEKDVEVQMTQNKYPEFLNVVSIQATDIEFDDEHPLNHFGVTEEVLDKYFEKQVKP